MSPFVSIALGCVFVGLAFTLRGQPRYGQAGFVLMIMAGIAWFIAAATGFANP